MQEITYQSCKEKKRGTYRQFDSMTEFEFSFEARKKTIHGIDLSMLGGVYNYLTDKVTVYLPNIADSVTIYIPDFMTMFKESFIHEVEDDCIEAVQKTINHEYSHVSLCRTECPLNKQHNAIEMIS